MVTHGTFLWKASLEGIVANNSVHAGIRCKFMVCSISTLVPLLYADNMVRKHRALEIWRMTKKLASNLSTPTKSTI